MIQGSNLLRTPLDLKGYDSFRCRELNDRDVDLLRSSPDLKRPRGEEFPLESSMRSTVRP